MTDKYGTDKDSDCYPNSSILINHLNITNGKTLEVAERDITTACAITIDFKEPPYDLGYLCTIHHTLFNDIYPWAGKIRSIDISKGNTRFCHAKYIEQEANKLFKELATKHYFSEYQKADLIIAVSELYGDLNMIHPFREGNGRSQRILFEHIIINAGFEIYWEPITQDEWINANIAAVVCDYSLLEKLFNKCIGNAL